MRRHGRQDGYVVYLAWREREGESKKCTTSRAMIFGLDYDTLDPGLERLNRATGLPRT